MAAVNLGRVGLVLKGDWSGATTYTALDIVSHDGNSWAAKRGNTNVEPTTENTDDWQLISNNSTLVATVQGYKEDAEAAATTATTYGNAVVSAVAPVEASSTASQAYAAGDFFIYNGTLYIASASIAQGGTITPNTNCTAIPKGISSEVTSLKSAISAMNTATASDEGKALKAKTVSGGKVTEWEFGEAGGGGEEYYTTKRVNLCNPTGWVDASSAPLIPVEYGKTYSANFNTYNFNIEVFDASKTSLGKINNYGGVTVTKDSTFYDSFNYRYTYEITKEAIAYIKLLMAIPSSLESARTVPMWFEGDVSIPINPVRYTDLAYIPEEPALGDLKKVMLGNHKVGRKELDSDLRPKIDQLGYSGVLVQQSNIYNYDSSNSKLVISDGVIRSADGVTTAFGECVYFNSNVDTLEYLFGYAGGGKLNPNLIIKDNLAGNGLVLETGNTGIGYLNILKEDGSVQAQTNDFAWTSEYTLVSLVAKRNSDNYVLTFTDAEDNVTVKTFTFASFGIVDDPGHFGVRVSCGAPIRNGTVACTDLKIGAEPIFAKSVSNAGSRLANKTWDAWGDSFTDGDSTYVSMVETATGCIATNLGNSGDKVLSVLSRFNSRADACGSYVTVFVGVNDFLSDTVLADFKTSVQSLIDAIIAKAPSSKFAWIIPPQTGYLAENTLNLTLEDYDDAIIEICRANSVPILDLYHSGGWYGTVSAFNSIYVGGDGLHPSTAGQAFLADKIELFLETL